jgi:PucR family transcriptional regulator, purine catabolism regulatory protein
MPVRLVEVLEHPVVRRGQPALLAGANGLDRTVRWVHSSDIFEIAPLLRQGDLLLSTGLGLLDRGADDVRAFVRSLAQRGVTGLVLETCRFYDAAPQEMVLEAEQVGLPLIGFDAVVPFVEVTEAVNGLIVDAAVQRLRHADEVSQQLSSVLVSGGGVEEVVARLEGVLGAPVRFVRTDGDVRDHLDADFAIDVVPGSTDDVLDDVDSSGTALISEDVPVLVHGAVAGWLRTRLADRDRVLGEAALERAASALVLALLRDERGATGRLADRGHLAGLLLDDAAAASTVRSGLLAAGLPTGVAYLTVVGTAPVPERLAAALDRACDGLLPRPVFVTAVAAGSPYVVSVLAGYGDPARLADGLVALLGAARLAELDATVAVGPVATDEGGVGRSVREARVALGAVWARAPLLRVVDCRRLGVERALLRGHDDAALRDLVTEHLGPLLDHDARRDTRLVETLRMVLDSPDGKSGAATRLHIRRQSLYQRLARVQRLLGVDLADPGVAAGLQVALRALDLSRAGPRGSVP